MELIITALIGIACIIIGILNTRGNISMLHSYHTKRVKEEDVLPFGKLVGTGTIIIGAGLLAFGALNYLASLLQQNIFATVATVVIIVGFVAGISISFYAMFKYNKGIF